VSAITAQEVVATPSPCWRPLSGIDIGAGADGGSTTAASARYHFVSNPTHRHWIMGKSMGAIPGATPFVAREGRDTGSWANPWAPYRAPPPSWPEKAENRGWNALLVLLWNRFQ